MSVRMYKRSQGIALFQVLLITAVISILAIQFTQTAKNQISIASTIVDRTQAQALMRTTEAELLFALITEPRRRDEHSQNDYAKVWNFYGESFIREPSDHKPLDNSGRVEVTLQDQNGLLSLYRGFRPKLLERLIRLVMADYPAEKAYDEPLVEDGLELSVLANSLIDWQDRDDFLLINGAESQFYKTPGMPTNLPLQTYEELKLVRGFTPQLLEALWPYVTIRPQDYFNPMQAPEPLMSLLVSEERAKEILRLREAGQLDSDQFERLSGLEVDENMFFFTSGQLRIELMVKVKDVVLTKRIEMLIQPYDKHPYIEHEIKI